MTRSWMLAAALLVAYPAANAASLRGLVVLQDGSVRLSDLFDGADHDRVIGPAPEPGGRIVVEAAQLAAIARQFNVDWHPASAGDRTILERPGSAFGRAEAMAALRIALTVAGVPADADVDVPLYIPPMVTTEGRAAAEVGQLDYDPATGRFTAMLSVSAEGMLPAHVRMSGHVQLMEDLPVAARRLSAGDVLVAADMRTARLPVRAVRMETVQLAGQAIGMTLRHTVAAGAPLPLAELSRPLMVHKDGLVTMQLDTPGIAVTAQGVAGEDGALGDRIRVMNPVSRAVMTAEVMGQARVRVTAGQPVILAPGQPIGRTPGSLLALAPAFGGGALLAAR